MKWILWTLAALIAVAGIVACVGWLLPVGHVAAQQTVLPKTADEVDAAISDGRKLFELARGDEPRGIARCSAALRAVGP